MELLVRHFVNLSLGVRLLDASAVKRAVKEIEAGELQGNANVPNIDLEGDLRHLRLGLIAGQHFVLFLHGFVGFLLSLIMLSSSPDADCLKYEALHLEHMERIVLLNCHFVFADVLKELLEERIVGVFNQVK